MTVKTWLCIDTAKRSGHCNVANTDATPWLSGECDAFGPYPYQVCLRALTVDPKCTLVLEKPSHGNRTTLVGLGQAHGAWLVAWYQAGGKKSRVKRIYPATWRASLWGDTSKMPLREKLFAQAVTGRVGLGADESAACCLAEYCRKEL